MSNHEESMLSFEMSAIDLILALAVIILLVLYLTKPSPPPPEQTRSSGAAPSPAASPSPVQPTDQESASAPASDLVKSPAKSVPCPYGYDQMKNVAKTDTISDDCLNCPNIMECYSRRRIA